VIGTNSVVFAQRKKPSQEIIQPKIELQKNEYVIR
jgi:hypothetical protein